MAHCMRCTSPASCDVWGCVPGTFPSEKRDVREQLHTALAIRIARAVDHVVGVALERRYLTLEQARPRLTRQPMGLTDRPRLTRQPMGLTDRLLLDGRPLVDIGPLQFDWSEDGLCCNVTVPTKETPL